MSDLGIQGLGAAAAVTPGEAARPATKGFAQVLVEALANTNQAQLDAEAKTRGLVVGENDAVDAMLALSQADLSLRFLVSLRNRALEAYQEILRLQV